MKILSPKAAKELNLKSIPDFVFEDDIYKNGWLNVEYEYRRNGWDVEYERDGNFSKFIFKPKG